MSGSSTTKALGIVMVGRKSGNVLFCHSACFPIGKIAIAENDRVTTYGGGNADVFLANESRGEVVRCGIEIQRDMGWAALKDGVVVFKSGKCTEVAVVPAPRP